MFYISCSVGRHSKCVVAYACTMAGAAVGRSARSCDPGFGRQERGRLTLKCSTAVPSARLHEAPLLKCL